MIQAEEIPAAVENSMVSPTKAADLQRFRNVLKDTNQIGTMIYSYYTFRSYDF